MDQKGAEYHRAALKREQEKLKSQMPTTQKNKLGLGGGGNKQRTRKRQRVASTHHHTKRRILRNGNHKHTRKARQVRA
jgi:hypothetical protein